mmetsp:Transcript_56924/g.144380  ORF Transcript_56924/g.144380 Transcript_56924/m.144380 type:complete len:497 (+) Transcript_56924:121-1611(+)
MATAADAAREFATGPQVAEAARQLLSCFPLPELCEALANARPEDAGHLFSAIERLAQFEDAREAFLGDNVVSFLRQGAESQSPQIRTLVAKLVARLVKEGGEVATSRLASHGLLEACEVLLMDEETGTAEAAVGTFCVVVQFPTWREAALGAVERLQGRLGDMLDVQRIRVLHLFVELGRASDDVFASLERRGAYRQVLGAFLTEDILLKLNAVELMEALGSFPAGQDLLSREGLPQQLAQELLDPMCDDSVRLCVVRLLGLILRRTPATMDTLLPGREAPLAQNIAGMLESTNPAERLCALNAWADLSQHPAGLAFFLQWEGRLQAILAHVASTQNEVCKGAMASWAAVLQVPPPTASGAQGAQQLSEAPEILLWQIAENRLLPLVLENLTAKPFADVRCHVWQLLALLVQSRSAAQVAVPSEHLRELLLDFTSETDCSARIAKHAFVQSLQRHDQWLNAFLDENVVQLLAEFAQQGPHWVPCNAAAMVGDQAGA